MISDNLAPLFDPGQPGVRFRQGTITAWNPATGQNMVDLAGGTLTDVPMLNTGEAIALKAGHVVGLLGQGNSWFIIGRVTPANDPNFAGASVAFGRAQDFQQGFAVPTTETVNASASLDVPSWVDEVAIMCVATATLVNSTTVRQEALLYAGINGATGSAMAVGIPPDSGSGGYGFAALTAVNSAIITNPPASIPLTCITDCTGGFGASGVNTATVDAIALFRSTV